jgi:hypothetical protein
MHEVVLLEVAPDRGPIDFADNRMNGTGKWVFSSQLQGATVVQAKVARSKASGVTCRSARSARKSLVRSLVILEDLLLPLAARQERPAPVDRSGAPTA